MDHLEAHYPEQASKVDLQRVMGAAESFQEIQAAKTDASDEVTIDAKANQTYFLRGSVGLGFFVGHPHLTIVPAEEAEKEIADCKLLPEQTTP